MRILLVLILISALLAACGQKGPLVLPEKTAGGVVTRPTQTPPATPATTTDPQKKKDESGNQP
jgi:predicted small lipoprotein YifL